MAVGPSLLAGAAALEAGAGSGDGDRATGTAEGAGGAVFCSASFASITST